jgi:steroid 5-alpha reductase family enzyme
MAFAFDYHNLLFCFVIVFGLQVVFFLFAAAFRTDKLTDLSYGLSFVLVTLFLLLLNGERGGVRYGLLAIVCLWGMRLGLYLFLRILRIGRDERFDGRREKTLAFAAFWGLQAVTIWVVMMPVTMVMSVPGPLPFRWPAVPGALVWAAGFAVEFLADQQKYAFKNDPANAGRWVSRGLWKYSRHPNYFGESLCWVGVLVFALPYLRGAMLVAALSPIYITFLLLFVSGIPLLEKKADKKYGSDPAYREYRDHTSLFVPRAPAKR